MDNSNESQVEMAAGADDGRASGEAGGSLEPLRQEIDSLDRQIVSLLARRKSVVQEVIQVKQAQGLPMYHPAREENLISMRRRQAETAGLDPDFVEEIFRNILKSSRTGQLRTLGRRGVKHGAKVLIVGGLGSMGSFFARWFAQSDCEVRVLDLAHWPQVEQLTKDLDLAMLAVPIEATPEAALRLGPYLPKGCVLCDITSLKAKPLAAMLAGYHGPVVGLHPLFGPSTTNMDQQIVVVSPGRDARACQWVLEQFSVWGNVMVETEPDAHDEAMSIVQALRHFATFAFGRFLCARKVPIARTLDLSAPIYRLEMGMVGRLFAQNPALYAEIVFATPERQALLKEFVHSMSQNLDMIERGDKQEFVSQFKKIADWFGPFGEQAMRETTFLIDKLVHRI